MQSIKSYTDLEQSKKLAEILSIQSADMHYNDWNDDFCVGYKHTGEYIVDLGAPITIRGELEIPCWSLAALLNVLPNDNSKCTTMTRGRYDTRTRKYINGWCVYYNEINGANCMNVFAENPVDACVAMVEQLHKLNLLQL